MINKKIRIGILLLSFSVMLLFLWGNYEICHWKTFYQSVLSQIFLFIGFEFFYNMRKKKKFILRTSFFSALILYWIILVSFIVSLTMHYNKLGRAQAFPDLFRYYILFIPLLVYYNSDNKISFITTNFQFVLLLTSISFYYTYSEIPELSLFLSIPIILTSNINIKALKFFNPILILSGLIFIVLHLFLTQISFSGYTLICFLILGIVMAFQNIKLSPGFWFLILVVNSLHVLSRQYMVHGSIDFFSKDSSSILNSNRVAGYFSILVPLGFHYFISKNLKFNTTKGFLYLFISICILFIQFSRGALIGLALGALFIFIVWNSRFKIFQFYGFIFFIIFYCFFSLLPFIIFYLDRLKLIDSQQFDLFTSGRFELWKLFFHIYLSKLNILQKIIGIGTGQNDLFLSFLPLETGKVLFHFVTHGNGSYIHPHNLQLGILLYGGVIGFVIINALLLKIFILNLHNISYKDNSIYFTSILIFVIHGSFDFLIDTISIFILVVLFLSNIQIPRRDENKYNYLNKSKYINISILYLLFILDIFLIFRSYDRYIILSNKTLIDKVWLKEDNCIVSKIPDLNYLSNLNDSEIYTLSNAAQNLSGHPFTGLRNISDSQESSLILLAIWKIRPSDINKQIARNSFKQCLSFHYRAYSCEVNYQEILDKEELLNFQNKYIINDNLFTSFLRSFCKI